MEVINRAGPARGVGKAEGDRWGEHVIAKHPFGNHHTLARLRSRCTSGRSAALASLLITVTGCDAVWGEFGLPFFGAPIAWVDPSVVSASSRASGPFGVAITLPVEPGVQTVVAGAITAPDEVVTYQIGAIQPGDLISVEVNAQDRGFDAAVAVFDAELNVIHLNDDRNYYARITDAAVQFTARQASAECYVVVSGSVRSDSTGAYQLHMTRIPGETASVPQPQVVYLVFNGEKNVSVGGRTGINVPAFDGSQIDPVFAIDTYALRELTIERIRADYAAYDVIILSSSEQSRPREPHTTLYFGSYSPTLLGLADSVDTFNTNPVQRAIVFVDTFTVFMSQAPSVEEMADALANVASHEIGHLIGLHHTKDPGAIMDTSATLRQMLRPQTFMRAPLNGDTFPVGFQDSPRTLLANVGGDPVAAYAAEAALLRAKSIDPWYDDGPQFPAREAFHFGSACSCH
jgi:hypothetical protein